VPREYFVAGVPLRRSKRECRVVAYVLTNYREVIYVDEKSAARICHGSSGRTEIQDQVDDMPTIGNMP
jgi:hypothetical protein